MEEKKIYIGFKLLFRKWRFFISFLLKKKKFISFFLICAEFLPNFMDPLSE